MYFIYLLFYSIKRGIKRQIKWKNLKQCADFSLVLLAFKSSIESVYCTTNSPWMRTVRKICRSRTNSIAVPQYGERQVRTTNTRFLYSIDTATLIILLLCCYYSISRSETIVIPESLRNLDLFAELNKNGALL